MSLQQSIRVKNLAGYKFEIAFKITTYEEKVKIHLVIIRMRIGVHNVHINSIVMVEGPSNK